MQDAHLTTSAPFEAARARFNQGDMTGVLDLLGEMPSQQRAEPRTRVLLARTLAQSGQPEEARQVIRGLLDDPGTHHAVSIPDLIALEGRSWKDEWQLKKGSPQESRILHHIIERYQAAYRAALTTPNSLHDLYYAAINVATFAQLAGLPAVAREHAEIVLQLCKDADAMLTGDRPNAWPLGSRAEAHALLGHTEEALRDYKAMADSGLLSLRDLCSARKQARLVADCIGSDPYVFDPAFKLPSIAVFAGHRLDDSQRSFSRGERLPAEVLGALRTQLDRLLADLDARISYSSAAAGADIVFLEAMQARGVETHILLSSPEVSFRRTNIENAPDASWAGRFESVLATARSPNRGSVMAASPHEPREDSIAFSYANLIMSGQALHRARQLDLELHPIVVWDELPGDGPGGTADFYQLWKDRGYKPQVINPTRLPRTAAAEVTLAASARAAVAHSPRPPARSAFRQEIKAVLFADVRNFSKLSENQVELFSRHYLGRVSQLISQPVSGDMHPPLVCNTWGDAFYMVFDTVRDAGVFALQLQEALVPPPVGHADWAVHDLPEDLSIRIALHAGPIFSFSDPVIRNISFTGRHVSFAARLEPVTPPGQIYCSEAFASLSVMGAVREYRCDYMGMVRAAKDFGIVRAFRVSAAASHHR